MKNTKKNKNKIRILSEEVAVSCTDTTFREHLYPNAELTGWTAIRPHIADGILTAHEQTGSPTTPHRADGCPTEHREILYILFHKKFLFKSNQNLIYFYEQKKIPQVKFSQNKQHIEEVIEIPDEQQLHHGIELKQPDHRRFWDIDNPSYYQQLHSACHNQRAEVFHKNQKRRISCNRFFL